MLYAVCCMLYYAVCCWCVHVKFKRITQQQMQWKLDDSRRRTVDRYASTGKAPSENVFCDRDFRTLIMSMLCGICIE